MNKHFSVFAFLAVAVLSFGIISTAFSENLGNGGGGGSTAFVQPSTGPGATFVTNFTTPLPWLTISGQGTRIITLSTNSTAIPLANTDGNGAGITNAPAGAISGGLSNQVLTASGAGLPATFAAAASGGAATNVANIWTANQQFSAGIGTSAVTISNSGPFQAASYFATNAAINGVTNSFKAPNFYKDSQSYGAKFYDIGGQLVGDIVITSSGIRIDGGTSQGQMLSLFDSGMVLAGGNFTIGTANTFTCGRVLATAGLNAMITNTATYTYLTNTTYVMGKILTNGNTRATIEVPIVYTCGSGTSANVEFWKMGTDLSSTNKEVHSWPGLSGIAYTGTNVFSGIKIQPLEIYMITNYVGTIGIVSNSFYQINQ